MNTENNSQVGVNLSKNILASLDKKEAFLPWI